MEDYGHRKDEKGLPVIEDCTKHSFEGYYTSPEVAAAFHGFYNNKNGVFDKFLNFWDLVSKRFTNNDYVIGYDLLNEPWPANLYYDPLLLIDTTKFDREILFPLTQKATRLTLKNAPEKLVFFEPAQFPDSFPLFGGITFKTGFPELPGGNDKANLQVLNDHTYCC